MVAQIVRLADLVEEVLLVRGDGVLLLLAGGLLRVELRPFLLGLLKLLLDDGQGFGSVLGCPLNLSVVKKPLGEEVDGVLGCGLVHHSHALGDDSAQLGALQVLSVCHLLLLSHFKCLVFLF